MRLHKTLNPGMENLKKRRKGKRIKSRMIKVDPTFPKFVFRYFAAINQDVSDCECLPRSISVGSYGTR
jgi:hypothetical protein